ncbi:MAG: cation transporter [Mycoplasmatales bacterium]
MLKKDLLVFEKRATNLNIPFVFIMAGAGLVFGTLANSSAILLDGSFSFVLFLTIFLGKYIQKHTSKPKNFEYPMGKSSLESLYVLFKILILIGLLMVSFSEALAVFLQYANGTYIEQEIIQFYANIYYIVKMSAFAISYGIYSYYINLIHDKSNVLRIDRKGTFLDGIITLAIMFGLFFLSFVPILAPIADSVVLFFLASYLLFEMFRELSHEIQTSLGKRCFLSEEKFYKSFFNNYFVKAKILDVYINQAGDSFFAYVTLSFEGKVACEDIVKLEKTIKYEMNKKFDEIFIELYFDNHVE